MTHNIRTTVWYGYFITGNQYLAIAINLEDEKDVHYFDIDPDVNNDAFVRACGWAYPGEGSEDEAREFLNRKELILERKFSDQKVEICGGLASNYQIADEEAREFLNRKD